MRTITKPEVSLEAVVKKLHLLNNAILGSSHVGEIEDADAGMFQDAIFGIIGDIEDLVEKEAGTAADPVR